MIATVWKIGWLNLLRDRPALALTFAAPLLFFSIFAAVFGSMESGGVGVVRATLVFADDGRRTETERGLARLLATDARLDLEVVDNRAEAERRLRSGRAAASIMLPSGLTESIAGAEPGAPESAFGRSPIEILVDKRANPIAAGVVEGALRGAIFRLWAESRFPVAGSELEVPVGLAIRDIVSGDGGGAESISFFAAGISVMFLLFAVSGRGSILIEERRGGILARMLTSGVGLTTLLAGRWLYLASLGFAQVSLMFVWGSIAFGLDLWSPYRLAGFALMTAAAASAAAALGLLLSVLCRTRAQLNGVAVVLVLAMSALGGSLFPRFLMPDSLRMLGLATFNAWALDGYQKVFWYGSPLVELWPQITVLAAAAAILLAISRLMASRSVHGGGV